MQKLELAQMNELKEFVAIINMGKEFQREQGFTQWTDDYPNEEILRGDIESQKGYVLKMDEKIVGYMCIDFDGEPAYDNIDGKWNTKPPYAVVHRLALSRNCTGKGLSDMTFRLIEELCRSKGINSIRVDTDFPNKRMQHILEKNGFSKCGTILFQGSGRLAYDKTFAE